MGEQFYSCFISHSGKDKAFCDRLYERMRGEHLLVWYAPKELRGGRSLREQIKRAIGAHDKLLLVLSEDSMSSSWVESELRDALALEEEHQRRILFPIMLVDFERVKAWECFDSDSGRDMAVKVREYYIPDFRCWEVADDFDAAFARLLKDLQAEAER